MTGVTVRACAKVNFCLRVLGRRPDGYHNVETVLHTISLWDQIRLTPRPDESLITLAVNAPDFPGDESNTCWQAASLLAERARLSPGVAISLEKNIPVAAGLGGGSSDAAATLVGLARLWGIGLRQEELDELGAQIGADVPFFLRGGCCLARGMGEKLEPLPSLGVWLVVLVPARRVSTAQAYAALGRGATRGRRRGLTRAVQRSMEAIRLGTPQALAASLHNDFEALPMGGIEDARAAKAALIEAGCLGAAVSGSGSGAFGICPDREAAVRAASQLQPSWPWVRVASTLPPDESMIISEG